MQWRMPPGMPDISVKHIRRDLIPCLLELPGELFDVGNCLQLVGTLLQNRSRFSMALASVLLPGQTSRTQK